MVQVWSQEFNFYWLQFGKKALPDAIKTLEISKEGKILDIPEKIKVSLLEYLKNPKYWTPFDCHAFVWQILGRDRSINNAEKVLDDTIQWWDIWYIARRDSMAMDPSTYTIVSNDAILHKHLYLWEGLFLWKWWNGWPLVISTNEAMEKLRWWDVSYFERYQSNS
jgi:hypothetical protein